jgi:hypothetical protein
MLLSSSGQDKLAAETMRVQRETAAKDAVAAATGVYLGTCMQHCIHCIDFTLRVVCKHSVCICSAIV